VRLIVPVTVFVSITMLAAACSGGGSAAQASTAFPGAAVPTGSWPDPNGDIANARDEPGSAISAAVPDDFQDHDLQASPISAVIGGVPAIISGGKVGYVYALNARSGALLWKTPVGEHNGHDNDSLLALSHRITVKFPYTVAPGSLGGILSDMAVAGGSVYAATIDLPIT